MAFTSNNDVNILSSADAAIVGAGAGNDTYIISPGNLPTSTQTITISDTLGTNKVQLIGGLTIASSIVAANAIQLKLSNGATININGADTFTFEIGGDPLLGTPGTIQTFNQFVTTSLGVAAVPTGSTTATGATNVGVNANGTTTAGGAPGSYTLTADAPTVVEGNSGTTTLTYTVSLDRAATEAVDVAVAVAATGTATAGTDFVAPASTLSFAVGEKTKTVAVTVNGDTTIEANETVALTFSGAKLAAPVTATGTITNDDSALTYTLAASATSLVSEGNQITFTVTPSSAPATAVTLYVQLTGASVGAITTQAAPSDFSAVLLPVTIPAGSTAPVTVSTTVVADTTTEGPEGFQAQLLDAGFAVVTGVAAITGTITEGTSTGQTFTLTKGVDKGPDFTGGSGNDTFIADYDVVNSAHTLGSLDVINGSEGVDTLKITSDNSTTDYEMAAATIGGIEKIEIRGSDVVTADVSGSNVTGLESISVLQAGSDVEVSAADTADILVSGVAAEGSISAFGGKNVTVTTSNEANDITIGDATNDVYAVGAIKVNGTKQTGKIDIDGGETVTVDVTSSKVTGNIAVGANQAATGAVEVTQNLTVTKGEALDNDDQSISVTGGTTVDVTINASTTATKGSQSGKISIGDVNVTGDGNTTAVTVTQNASVTTFTDAKVAETMATQTVTFKALKSGESAELGGLTFTASKALTAEQVAAAFAALTAADTQDKGGPTANGDYSGTFSDVWSSTSVSGATVTFTGDAYNTEDLTTTTGTLVTVNPAVDGTDVSGGTVSTNDVVYGAVVVNDDADAAITTITLDGFSGATLGTASTSLDALTTLSLANSVGNTTLDSTSKTLAVTVDNLDGGDVDLGGSVQTLTLTTTGAASDIDLVAEGVKSLTIDAGADLTLQTGTNFDGALETVTVKGAGAVDLDSLAAATKLKSFDASANTGGVTADINANKAVMTAMDEDAGYVFSQGADIVTLTHATVSLDVNLGAGNDSITLATGTEALAATIDGGTGTNTLVMAAADAATVSANNQFQAQIANIQQLHIGQVAASTEATVNMSNMDGITYVISDNAAIGEGAPAVFTYNLAGLVLDTDGTVTLGGEVIYTAETNGKTATDIATAIGQANAGQGVAVNIDGVAYRVTQTLDVDNNPVETGLTLTSVLNVVVATAPVLNATGFATDGEPNVLTFDIAGIVLNNNGTLTIGDGDDSVTLYTAVGNGVTAANIASALNGTTVKLGMVDYTVSIGTDPDPVTAITLTATVDGPPTFAEAVLTLGVTGAAVETPKAKHQFSIDLTGATLIAAGTLSIADPSVPPHAVVTLANTFLGLNTAGIIAAILDTSAYTINGVEYVVSVSAGDKVTFTAQTEADANWEGYTVLVSEGSTAPDSTEVTQVVKGVQADERYELNSADVTGENSGTASNPDNDSDIANPAFITEFKGVSGGGVLTIDNLADNGTVELVKAGAGLTVNVKDADAEGANDNVLNVVTGGGNTALGTLTVADVETVKISTTQGYDADGDSLDYKQSLTLNADSVTGITVAGAGSLNLSFVGAATPTLETVNASTLTGNLTFTAAIADLVVTTGEGDDDLTAHADGVKLVAGNGDDTLKVEAGADTVRLNGGLGNDTFIINGAASTLNNYAVIEGVNAGDVIKMAFNNDGDLVDFALSFREAKITLSEGSDTTLLAYANKAVADLAAGEMGWFQRDGNTFIVLDVADPAAGQDTFVNGDDMVVMITGLVDLSKASFNTTFGTLEIA